MGAGVSGASQCSVSADSESARLRDMPSQHVQPVSATIQQIITTLVERGQCLLSCRLYSRARNIEPPGPKNTRQCRHKTSVSVGIRCTAVLLLNSTFDSEIES